MVIMTGLDDFDAQIARVIPDYLLGIGQSPIGQTRVIYLLGRYAEERIGTAYHNECGWHSENFNLRSFEFVWRGTTRRPLTRSRCTHSAIHK